MTLHEGFLEMAKDPEFVKEYVKDYQKEAVLEALDRVEKASQRPNRHHPMIYVNSEIEAIRKELA